MEPVSLELRNHSFVRMWHRLIARQFNVSPEEYDKVEVAWPTVIFSNWFYVTVMYLLESLMTSAMKSIFGMTIEPQKSEEASEKPADGTPPSDETGEGDEEKDPDGSGKGRGKGKGKSGQQ